MTHSRHPEALAKRASKSLPGLDPGATARTWPLILRGPLRGRLRMTVNIECRTHYFGPAGVRNQRANLRRTRYFNSLASSRAVTSSSEATGAPTF